MTTTISGHDAIASPSDPRLDRVPVGDTGWAVVAHEGFAPILAAVALDWHREVAPLRLDPLECWSWAYRAPRAGAGTSDHAGYAIDLNSAHEGAQGPYGGMRLMSEAQKAACRRIANRYRPVVFWGGPVAYGGQYRQERFWDPMHWYIRRGATPAQAAALLAELEDDMTPEDRAALAAEVAEAVWTRLTAVDGEDKKMGAMVVATFKNTRQTADKVAPPADPG